VVNPKRPTFGPLSHRSEQQESYRKKEYQNTGLMKESSQTQEFILEGFWMQGEFVSFLTLDPANHLYLELYGFETESIFPLGSKVELSDIRNFENVKLAISDNREFIAIVFYSNVSLPPTDPFLECQRKC
jgi:hypothetical protein